MLARCALGKSGVGPSFSTTIWLLGSILGRSGNALADKMEESVRSQTKMKSGFTAYVAFDRETKGAVRYAEIAGPTDETRIAVENGAKLGHIYVRKTAFNGESPKRLKIRIRDVGRARRPDHAAEE
jgi:hypothetical protein